MPDLQVLDDREAILGAERRTDDAALVPRLRGTLVVHGHVAAAELVADVAVPHLRGVERETARARERRRRHVAHLQIGRAHV